MKKFVSLVALILAAPAFAHPGGHGADTASPDARGSRVRAAPPAAQMAHGRAGDAAKASRTVAIELTPAGSCSPASIPVKQGETLRLVAKNAARSEQHLALGTAGDLKSYAEMVQKHPQMQASQASRIVVGPGESRELVWQFTKPGEFQLSCGVPARFDAASAGRVIVKAR